MGTKYSAYNSDYISYTLENEKGRVAFFGIESGARDRDKHASYNLMLPGYGGVFGAFKKALPNKWEADEKSAVYENKSGASVKYEFDGTRELNIEMNGALPNDIFSVRFAIKTAPPTIWTKKMPKKLKSRNALTMYKTEYQLPMYVHFPDFGRVEITASSPDVYCIEELQQSKDFMGIDLGYLNYGYSHNRMHGLHYGSSFLTFKTKGECDKVSFKFRVMDEAYPPLPEDDERFNGLKRNWLNAFALNRELFDMADNIYFHGTGHLAIHMKSDMLQIVDKNDEQFRIIRRVFERQVERTFKTCQCFLL